MAFPDFEAIRHDFGGTGENPWPLLVPDGSNVTGKKLVIFVKCDFNRDNRSVAGATALAGTTGNDNCGVWLYEVDGSEGWSGTDDSLDFTHDSSGVNKTSTVVRASADVGDIFAALTQDSNDPPSLDPGLGAQDFLWATFWGYRTNSGDPADATPPTNYADLSQFENSVHKTAVAFRDLNAESEDPGTWSDPDLANNRGAATVAIEPAEEASGRSSIFASSVFGGLE